MKKWIFLTFILAVFNFSHLSFSEETEKVIFNDPFLRTYQWGLWPWEQSIVRDTTDIHSKTFQVNEKAHIGFFNSSREPLSIKFKRKKVVVAVIDSGLDTFHKDLENVIEKNIQDCNENKRPPFFNEKTEDKDKNGYPGDCVGWDFSNPKKETNQMRDNKGHGTHVASIISAESANNSGMSGLSNQIKILPIKVFGSNSNKKSSDKDLETSQDKTKDSDKKKIIKNKFQKALEYAISQNVDVINMSFGWPLAADRKSIRDVIQKALDKNITIVAGVGNQNHNAFILPCSIEGVICVGASDIRGELSSFSNYGGHVDLLAPGEQIFGAFPSRFIGILPPSKNLNIEGYETLTGTSQAAPFVSSAVAFLKGLFPKIQNDEIKARLFLSASGNQNENENGYTLNGLFNLRKAIEAQPQAVIQPVFKNQREVELIKKQAVIQFKVKNYWKKSQATQVKVSLENSPQEYLFSYPQGFQKGEEKVISIKLPISDEWMDSKVSYLVSIEEINQKPKTFRHEVNIFKNFKTSSFLQKINIPVNQEVAKILKNKFSSRIGLESFYEISNPSGSPSYYTLKDSENGVKIFIWKYNESGVFKLHEIFVENLVYGTGFKAPSLSKYDINNDGNDEYIIIGLKRKQKDPSNKDKPKSKAKKEIVLFSFFDHNLEPLFTHIPHQWEQKIQRTAFNFKNPNIRFLNYYEKTLGSFKIPFLVERNYPPQKDLSGHPDDDFLKNTARNYIFYLKPEVYTDSKNKTQVKLEERIVDHHEFMKGLRENLIKFQKRSSQNPQRYYDAQNPHTRLEFLNLQFQKDNSKMKAILAIGEGAQKRFYNVVWRSQNFKKLSPKNLFEDYFFQELEYGNRVLEKNITQALTYISEGQILPSEAQVFVRNLLPIDKQNRVLITDSDNNSQTAIEFETDFQKPRDRLTFFKKVYKIDDKDGFYYTAFYESQNQIITKVISPSSNSKNETSKTIFRKVIRSEFFPDVTFTEILRDLVIQKEGVLKPALYVDASKVYSKRLFLWVLDDKRQELISPIRYSFKIPEECISLQATSLGASQDYKGVFMCQEEDAEKPSWSLYYQSFQ